MSISTKYGGLKIINDTGPPQDVDNYTTLILFHGFSFHSGIFSRLLPFAAQHKCRIVLVNRRGYPGAESHTAEDLQLLRAAQDSSPHGVETLSEFLKHSAHSIFTLLESFVAEERLPVSGGIVLVGWSICGVLMTSLLASASSFSSKFDLSPYIKRVVTFDSPYHALGFARPPGSYNPLDDDAIPPQDRGRHFGLWVSGYYDHPSPTTYEQHTALQHPPPTLSTMTPSDFAETLAPEPSTPPDGPDFLMFAALPFGAAREMRRAAMTPPTSEEGWSAVEWRHVWCDRSGWEMPFAAKSMREEIAKMDDGEESRDKARRKVVLVRWRGANHFAHWDYPEQTLKALLEDGREDVQIC